MNQSAVQSIAAIIVILERSRAWSQPRPIGRVPLTPSEEGKEREEAVGFPALKESQEP